MLVVEGLLAAAGDVVVVEVVLVVMSDGLGPSPDSLCCALLRYSRRETCGFKISRVSWQFYHPHESRQSLNGTLITMNHYHVYIHHQQHQHHHIHYHMQKRNYRHYIKFISFSNNNINVIIIRAIININTFFFPGVPKVESLVIVEVGVEGTLAGDCCDIKEF